MELFDQDGNQVTERMVALSDTQILHICAPVFKDTKLSLKIPSSQSIQVPHDTIQIVAASPSEKCNEYSWMQNQLSPTIAEARVTGPVEVDLNTIYAPSNKLDVRMGQGSSRPELKVSDKDGSTILGV